MSNSLLIAKVVFLAKDKRVWKWLAVLLSIFCFIVALITTLPVVIVTAFFGLLSPTGAELQDDPYYKAIQSVRRDMDIENDLPVIVAKSVALVLSGDILTGDADATDFIQQHFVGTYENEVIEQILLPSGAVKENVHIEVIHYYYSATDMLRIVQSAPYNFSPQDIDALQEMYAIADGNVGLDSFIGTLPMPVSGYITSGYGNRYDPINNKYMMHPALDILPYWHAPVKAIADGEVVTVVTDSIYGNNVTIMHRFNGQPLYSFNAHLSRVDVVEGQSVTQGQIIGLEGGDQQHDPNPGRTTGHHLHFELWKTPTRSGHVDPSKYLCG